MNNDNDKKLVIISGASKSIGKAFLDEYKRQDNTICLGLNRTGTAGVKLDVMDVNATYEFTHNIDLTNISRIVYMHTIGIDKFEPNGKPHIDHDGDGIDDEILASNYLSFLHLAEPLIDKTTRANIPMTICNIGSVSDVFLVPYWQSFSRAKNKVRQFCKSITDECINSIVLNVSSTLDETHNTYGRKNIDTTYWQTAKELVKRSFSTLDNSYKTPSRYAEFDFYKPNPSYRKDYFTNLQKLYAIWQRDLGFQGQEIPPGIRI